MLLQHQDDFYTRWLAKADAIDSEGIAGLIDRFSSLFINYIFLYNRVPIKVAAMNNIPVNHMSEKKRATSSVLDFLGAHAFAASLSRENLDVAVAELADAIEFGPFRIILKEGLPQHGPDARLVRHLRSPEPDVRLYALLLALYHIHCNLFQGEKALEDRQTELLQPATRLLRAVVVQTCQKLQRLPV